MVCTLSDSQAITETSLGLPENLRILAKHNKVTIVWMSRHKSLSGNELENTLARKTSLTIFTDPESVTNQISTLDLYVLSTIMWLNM